MHSASPQKKRRGEKQSSQCSFYKKGKKGKDEGKNSNCGNSERVTASSSQDMVILNGKGRDRRKLLLFEARPLRKGERAMVAGKKT